MAHFKQQQKQLSSVITTHNKTRPPMTNRYCSIHLSNIGLMGRYKKYTFYKKIHTLVPRKP